MISTFKSCDAVATRVFKKVFVKNNQLKTLLLKIVFVMQNIIFVF